MLVNLSDNAARRTLLAGLCQENHVGKGEDRKSELSTISGYWILRVRERFELLRTISAQFSVVETEETHFKQAKGKRKNRSILCEGGGGICHYVVRKPSLAFSGDQSSQWFITN